MREILLPELGEGIFKATVACWHSAVGAKVSADDDIVEVVTDKAVFNIPAGMNGIITEICVQPGQEAAVGSALARVEPQQ